MRLRNRGPNFRQVARGITRNSLVVVNGDNLVTSAGAVTEMTNQGLGGASYDPDVVVGTGANLKPHPTGTNLFYGASGDFVGGPVLSITSNVAVASYIDPDDITPSVIETIAAQSTSGQISFEFVILTDGKLRMTISADGSAVVNGDSDASIAGGEWVLGIWDDTANDVNFHTATGIATDDPATLTWTQLGTADIALSSVGMHNSSAVLEIGGNTTGTSERFNGNIGRTLVWSGTTSVTAGVLTVGTEAADSSPANWSTGTTYSSGGDTYTLTGNAFAQNTGHPVVHTIGSVGLETTALQAIGPPHTAFIVFRSSPANPGANQHIFDAHSGVQSLLFTDNSNSDKFSLFEGSTIALAEAYDTDAHVGTCRFNADATSELIISGVGSVTGDAGSNRWDYCTLFASTAGVSTFQGYIATLITEASQLSHRKIKSMNKNLKLEHRLP